MNGHDAHIIDIDHLVLTEMDLRAPVQASALIEAEVHRALAGTELGTSAEGGNETRVAGEVARSVMHALRGKE